MKHIVFVLGSYYPTPSAVGVCAEKIISRLSQEFRVTVIAFKSEARLKGIECFGDVKVVRVETKYQSLINRLQSGTLGLSRLVGNVGRSSDIQDYRVSTSQY